MAASFTIKEEKKLSRQDIHFSLARVPGTSQVYSGSSDGGIYFTDLAVEKPEALALDGGEVRHRPGGYVTGLALAADHSRLVSGSYDKQLIWWDVATRKPVHAVATAHAKWIRKVVASPDGKLVASVADDMVCRLWDGLTGKPLGELQGHDAETPHQYPSMLFTCALNADGSRLATADKVGRIVIWDVAARKAITTLDASCMYTWDPKQRRHSIGGVRALAFSPDGRQLAAGGIGQIGNIDHLAAGARVRIFDWEKGETLAEIESSATKGIVQRLAFHPQGQWLLGCGGDNAGFAILIDPATRKIAYEGKAPFHVHDFVVNEAADRVIVAGHNGLAVTSISMG
jgi:WD40 repeat protein